MVANISNVPDCEKLVKESMDWAGKIDILVNNAGTNQAFGPLESIQESAWDKIFQVNLKGAFFTSQFAYNAWMKDHGGVIINTASVGAFGAAPTMNVYGMTKAAMIHMTKVMAAEWKEQGVRVNALAPGSTLSEKPDDPKALEHRKQALGKRCLKKIQYPEDLIGVMVFLCSDASDFMSGQTMVVDGGGMMI